MDVARVIPENGTDGEGEEDGESGENANDSGTARDSAIEGEGD